MREWICGGEKHLSCGSHLHALACLMHTRFFCWLHARRSDINSALKIKIFLMFFISKSRFISFEIMLLNILKLTIILSCSYISISLAFEES
jgi:hypothetical protein